MTDRELLELAAKAAGIEIQNAAFSSGPHLIGTLTRWNPLTDDGDALRLAVKLGMSMVLSSSGFKGPTTWVRGGAGLRAEKTQPHEGDPYAATRRAIVCAAAEIGKGMK